MASACRILTIAREHGSGGAAVARRVAEALGWDLLDRHIVEEAARLANVDPAEAERLDENVDTWSWRLVKNLWAGAPDAPFPMPPVDLFDADAMAALSRRIVERAAARGDCVIVGRGAQCLLAGRDDARHVFIFGEREARVARVAARRPGADAAAEVDRVDRGRRAFVQRYYGCDWTAPSVYDLLLNARLGEDRAVELILRLVAGTA